LAHRHADLPAHDQLDLTGPYEVLARTPNAKVDLVARTLDR
jgi:hypothetical protein